MTTSIWWGTPNHWRLLSTIVMKLLKVRLVIKVLILFKSIKDNFSTLILRLWDLVLALWPSAVFWVGAVWLYSIVLHYDLIFTLVQNVEYFSILIWQKCTKYWTKVIVCGNSVHTKWRPKGLQTSPFKSTWLPDWI